VIKISYEIDKVKWIQQLQNAGVDDIKKIKKVISNITAEVSEAFEAGRYFQRRYAEDEK
jgi:methanogenic corrinoid protein MtbC1